MLSVLYHELCFNTTSFWLLSKFYVDVNNFSAPFPDSVERFHIASFLVFVLAQNILEAEGPWFQNFLYTLNMEPENSKKNLTFVPLAPACVVLRADFILLTSA
ncbi:hypothetical protein Tco_0358916 [Tanacetum coccineum]